MKPIIGIVGRVDFINPRRVTIIYNDIAKAVIANGGIPIMIMSTNKDFYDNEKSLFDCNNKNDLSQVLLKCDGVIGQGGMYFYDFDQQVIEYCFKNDIPYLGICLSMQAMSTIYGGDYVDLKKEYHNNKCDKAHEVILDVNSNLYKLLNINKFYVNSRHEHYVPFTSLDAVGYSDDGIIEAVEYKSKRFFIGVQWHPENLFELDEVQNKLFKKFIESTK